MLIQRRPMAFDDGLVLPAFQPQTYTKGNSHLAASAHLVADRLDALWTGKLQQGVKAPNVDDSSTASETIAASFTLQGPSKVVLARLAAAGTDAANKFVDAIRSICKGLDQGINAEQPAGAQKLVIDKLQDLHVCIVELDYLLEEHTPLVNGATSAVSEDCSQWLKQAQGYVLHLQRQINQAADDCSSDAVWKLLFQDAADALSRVAESITQGGISDDDSPTKHRLEQQQQQQQEQVEQQQEQQQPQPAKHQCSKRVCTRAYMPYNGYYAGKTTI
eukprot:jgi/Chrzof1/1660/Cz10g16080.t1